MVLGTSLTEKSFPNDELVLNNEKLNKGFAGFLARFMDVTTVSSDAVFLFLQSTGVKYMSRNQNFLRVISNEDQPYLEAFPAQKKSRRRAKGPRTPEVKPQQAPRYVKNLTGRTEGQIGLMEAIDHNDMVMALGPAGSGKTYIAIGKAVEALKAGKVQKIILARPAVEAGEKLGFLKGDLKEKVDPYMNPLYDALHDWMSPSQLTAWMAEGRIDIVPVAFMRGRTFKNAYIIVDEAQNATKTQLKMILTRMGFGSKMIINGDPDQSDLKEGESGLKEVADRIGDRIPGIAVVTLEKSDVIRHPLVKALLSVLN